MDITTLIPLSKCLDVTVMEIINGERIENQTLNNKSNEFAEVTIRLANKKIKKQIKKIVLTIIGIVILIVLISVFIYFKNFAYEYIYRYDIEPSEFINIENLQFEDEIIIKKAKLPEEEYLTLDYLEKRDMFYFLDVTGSLKVKKRID